MRAAARVLARRPGREERLRTGATTARPGPASRISRRPYSAGHLTGTGVMRPPLPSEARLTSPGTAARRPGFAKCAFLLGTGVNSRNHPADTPGGPPAPRTPQRRSGFAKSASTGAFATARNHDVSPTPKTEPRRQPGFCEVAGDASRGALRETGPLSRPGAEGSRKVWVSRSRPRPGPSRRRETTTCRPHRRLSGGGSLGFAKWPATSPRAHFAKPGPSPGRAPRAPARSRFREVAGGAPGGRRSWRGPPRNPGGSTARQRRG